MITDQVAKRLECALERFPFGLNIAVRELLCGARGAPPTFADKACSIWCTRVVLRDRSHAGNSQFLQFSQGPLGRRASFWTNRDFCAWCSSIRYDAACDRVTVFVDAQFNPLEVIRNSGPITPSFTFSAATCVRSRSTPILITASQAAKSAVLPRIPRASSFPGRWTTTTAAPVALAIWLMRLTKAAISLAEFSSSPAIARASVSMIINPPAPGHRRGASRLRHGSSPAFPDRGIGGAVHPLSTGRG